MSELRYLATPNLEGAYVAVGGQIHGIFRLKGSRTPSAGRRSACTSESQAEAHKTAA